MSLEQTSNNRTRKILWFFAVLITAKIIYSITSDYSEFRSWNQQGLFNYNPKSDLIRSFVYRGVFGLIPYCFFAIIGTRFSRSFWLAASVGLLVAAADIGSELSFRGSPDGQTAISIGILYLGLLICLVFLFLFCNFVLSRTQSKQDQG